ncbi:uncharacterized protein LOC116032935 [Ipomoea triloba]|uniref:uncharacterized protein LOC116032935 n=1 Tax=Ipomoea triloba TaxID=35885 RepID=UPI00125CF935|nr:uncharacterized protein LOC116032935 [Ipomoea triloba]
MSKRVQDEGDFTNVEGGGRGVPTRDESESSRLAEGTGSVAGDHDGEVRDLAVRLKALETYIQTLQEAARDDIEHLREDNASLKVEIGLMKLAVASGRAVPSGPSAGFKVPEPKAFGGARNSKELENFLWDMEEYFRVAGVPDCEKVALTSMYLSGDAKLWWRSRVADDASAGREKIESWDRLKKELKGQFLPGNASWFARESLRRLTHSGTLRDYVKTFSSLMLDVQNMSEDDKLFNFMSGLQPWAQAELRRQAVRDLPTAMAVADGLADYHGPNAQGKNGGKTHGESGNGKSVSKDKYMPMETNAVAEVSESRASTQVVCWTCGGNHFKRNCPKKQKLNAVKEDEPKDDGSPIGYCGPLRMV